MEQTKNRFLKTIKNIGLILIIVVLSVTLLSNSIIEKSAKNRTFNNLETIPNNEIGVVLGTRKYMNNNTINLYYLYRINATVNLYKQGKIRQILISGDNSRNDYDEPTQFKKDLIARGIPEEKIHLDFAGFRTLDSIIRAKKIFGLKSFTVISQKFHCERAIYIGLNNDIDIIGFNAQDVSTSYGLKTQIREYLARVNAILDIKTGKEPKFLGKESSIL